MKKTYVINIGRQLGSGGKDIGEIIAKELQIAFYDKRLINLASRDSGLDKEFFEKVDEIPNSGLFNTIFSFDYAENYLQNYQLFKIQSEVIEKLAFKQSCVFIGRCADYILRNHPFSVNIFIYANEEDRVNKIVQNTQITEKEARNLIEKTDKARREYYNFYTNKNWGEAGSYDLCINSSLLGIEKTAMFIIAFVKQKFSNI